MAAGLCFDTTAPAAIAKDKHFAKASADPSQDKIKEGLLLIREKNFDSAIDSFKQAIYFARNQYNPEAYKYLGLCYRATRQYPKAIESFNQFFSQTTEPNAEVRIDLAESYIEIGDFEKARRQLDTAAAEDDRSFHYRQRYATGELHERMGDAGKARDATGEWSEAAQFYQESIDDKPLYTDGWMGLGRAQTKMGQWNAALRTYRTILDKGPMLHPDLEQLYYNMGTCLLKRGDHQGALDHYHMALESNPDSFDSHLAIANILDSERHYGSAQKEYEAALRCVKQDDPRRMPIMRKIDFIEQSLQPKDVPMQIKPSPAMRFGNDEGTSGDASPLAAPLNTRPVGKDAGF
jgi:FimV-like protein